MRLLAIDPASAKPLAFSVWDYEHKTLLEWGKITLGELEKKLLEEKVEFVVVEEPYLKQNPRTLMALASVVGQIHYIANRTGTGFLKVPITTWQKVLHVHPKAPREARKRRAKEEAARLIKRHSTEACEPQIDDDIADAIMIGYWAVNNTEVHK